MSKPTAIEWTDRSSNPVRYRDATGRDVWACEKVSAGCRGCYAEALALRFDKGRAFNAGNMKGLTPYLSATEVQALLSPKRTPAGSKVFVGDMTDVFGSWVPDAILDQLFATFALRPDVVFQVLTKRPERMASHLAGLQAAADAHAPHTATGRFTPAQVLNFRMFAGSPKIGGVLGVAISPSTPWPLPNVWLGTSCEDQRAADERIPRLLSTPAAVRFLSCEPLLGPVDLSRHLRRQCTNCGPLYCTSWHNSDAPPGIHWVIVGGESGRDARPMHPAWARSLRDQCQEAGVPFHFKQWGEWCPSDIAPKPEPEPTTILKGTPAECVVMKRPPVSFQVVKPDGGDRLFNANGRFSGEGPTEADCWMHRVGKKNAGRLLDGRTWDEFPVPSC